MFQQQKMTGEKCLLNGICTAAKNPCQSASVFHGGSEDISDTEYKMRKGQAPGFVVTNRGDFIFVTIASITLPVFCISLQSSE